MTLSGFIVKLQKLETQGHGKLPVALADWQEQYRAPSSESAEKIAHTTGHFEAKGIVEHGEFICIGGDVFADVREEIERLQIGDL